MPWVNTLRAEITFVDSHDALSKGEANDQNEAKLALKS